MLKNYFKIAIRSLQKNKTYSFINSGCESHEKFTFGMRYGLWVMRYGLWVKK